MAARRFARYRNRPSAFVNALRSGLALRSFKRCRAMCLLGIGKFFGAAAAHSPSAKRAMWLSVPLSDCAARRVHGALHGEGARSEALVPTLPTLETCLPSPRADGRRGHGRATLWVQRIRISSRLRATRFQRRREFQPAWRLWLPGSLHSKPQNRLDRLDAMHGRKEACDGEPSRIAQVRKLFRLP
jgi:hypothetical protein